MAAKNLLVELLVEELPPRALKTLHEVFARTLLASLCEQGLAEPATMAQPYATPRRLAVHVRDVAARAADRSVRQKLMPVAVGLDADGKPTAALLKKLAALGASADDLPALRRAADGKAEMLFLERHEPGITLAEGLQNALEAAIAALPIPKMMSYQLADGWSTVKFVRPAHRLLALHGADVVPIAALGLSAGRETLGHRFAAQQPGIAIRQADSYAEQLKSEGAVIASFAERRAEIESQLRQHGAAAGLTPIEDAALLDEVTALVEWPRVLACRFEEEFLEVPQECLILTMKANQKYFPLLDGAGRLSNRFLVVSNIRPDDPSAIIGGNERVVRPRLADARFFYQQDRCKSLAQRLPDLDQVVYHNQLGSQGERSRRVAALARAIGRQLGDEQLARQAERAAQLAKADLLTGMVGEFPELQGVMGRYYALHDGEAAEVADAIEDHYKPRFSGDALPRAAVGICLALADKLQTLADLFGIGQAPSGDKDPFALRRHALGVIRMLIERDLPLALSTLLTLARVSEASAKPLEDFIFERLAGQLREEGYSAQEVDAVLSLRPQRLGEIPRRLAAVRSFLQLPEAASLAAANKRVANLLKKVSAGSTATLDANLLREPAEQALQAALREVAPRADAAFDAGDYTASLQALAALKAPVDRFFEAVMVNVEDAALRDNRLALLAELHRAMNRIADLAKLSA